MLRRFPAGALKNAPSAPADPLGVHRARASFNTGCVADSCRTHVAVQFRFAVLTKTPHHALFGRVGHYVDMPASASATGTVQHRDSI